MTIEEHIPAAADAMSSGKRLGTFDAFVELAITTARSGRNDGLAITSSHPLLNGAAYLAFRKTVDIKTRREIGAFFSSENVAALLASKLLGVIDEDALVLDPTCGIGDLLIARAAHLPLHETLEKTLDAWGARLAGFDTREDLIRLCKGRLCIMARARGGFDEEIDPLAYFPNILVQDIFAEESHGLLSSADAVVFNPPFGKIVWHEKLDWAAGKINAAAIFLDHLTLKIGPNVPVAAVLPEVLRCGARYGRFKSALAERGYSGSFEARGQFDSWTDVDVFTTLLTRSDGPLWQSPIEPANLSLGDRFEVRVGTVVPHRDPLAGPERAYICAKTTPAWSTFTPTASRHHTGRAFLPPFVAIRRTSSPSDKMRAVGTIVEGDEPVAVENHLLVAIPNDGSVQSCEALLALLQSQAINDRLNDLMRCRHLTTGAIRSLPWKLLDE
ncbi:N-6 DNA methylase [Tianweitania sp. BSSL-BM11]|uniref:N-6 DNA methylase n=1 Tax=Tianweitania aestuarii TaxID=2814886 RepID=A0ABS5RYW5_9HYPH|nr:N-6 DNA methylase [Tianweitania aestuarii]MBS9721502.1 N-6 DNA methylase [Tianweitania aestuarii]